MIKVTTLNLWGRFHWHEREGHILAYLRSEKPDIIFFQEVVFLPEESAYTQPALLNKDLQYPYEQEAVTRLQTSEHYDNYREDLAILSKFPILKSETLVLTQDPSDHLQRIVQLIDVDHDGTRVKFANVHFSEHPELAEKHLKELLDLPNRRHEQRIIVGDFNIPYLDTLTIWQHRYNATATIPYISYPSSKQRIDYILLPKPDTFVDIKLSDDDLSDHRALTADIRFVS